MRLPSALLPLGPESISPIAWRAHTPPLVQACRLPLHIMGRKPAVKRRKHKQAATPYAWRVLGERGDFDQARTGGGGRGP